MARLVVNREEADLVTHELTRDIVTIGSAPLNHIVIDDPAVSAQHAILARVADSYRLKDLHSTNGTQVNGISITDAELKDGAEIRFGYVTGVFRDATASIDQARRLQVSSEHDRPAQVRVSETQSILRPCAE